MGCGCGGKKLPASTSAQVAAGKVKAQDPFPPSYFWNGPSPKK